MKLWLLTAVLLALGLCNGVEARAQSLWVRDAQRPKVVLDGPEYTAADLTARWNANRFPWNAPYAHTQWGWPVALVVPPTSNMQTSYGWGVTNTQMTPLYHQFGPSGGNPQGLMGAPGYFGGPLYPTPYWPSHTDQFGVYYVRGPW